MSASSIVTLRRGCLSAATWWTSRTGTCRISNFITPCARRRSACPTPFRLLTPCTIGNGWLAIINLGRYALSMYEKSTGIGVRVFIDPARLDKWPEIKGWFFKTKSKKEQDFGLLLKEIGEAAGDICGVRAIEVPVTLLEKNHRGTFAVCPVCGESYPAADGDSCLGCQGMDPYVGPGKAKKRKKGS